MFKKQAKEGGTVAREEDEGGGTPTRTRTRRPVGNVKLLTVLAAILLFDAGKTKQIQQLNQNSNCKTFLRS
jgi:hypothetical protein